MGSYSSNLDDILEEDMHHWYTKFMRESPSGLITLFELKTMLDMNGMTEEANSYVDQVFFTFDMDGDGYLDFVEYIAAISLLLKGEVNQKLKWYFKLFDQDGNGKIDKDELETIFKQLLVQSLAAPDLAPLPNLGKAEKTISRVGPFICENKALGN
ncbi:hypothetical protein ILYODFUR_037446 [Ilyodon furcidens]|uniref:EF-hand domain-containing protein n=1 Tax=Ilyodon furcidens TaxID=33524 RepID=A0ABV0U2Q4_9TELE